MKKEKFEQRLFRIFAQAGHSPSRREAYVSELMLAALRGEGLV